MQNIKTLELANNMGKFVQIAIKCRYCGQEYILNVTDDGYDAYMNGESVQDAFPCLSPEDRELLISGTCEKCWDKIFQDN